MATRLAHDEFGSGPPLVLLHAFPLARGMWRPQLAGPAGAARVVAPDLPGFGGSPPAAGWGVDAAADLVAGFLDDLGVTGPVVLGGLSMGGYVALAFARRHPARLRGLILADTKAEADGPEARATRDKVIALVREQGTPAVVKQMLPKLLGDTTRATKPGVVAEAEKIGLAQSAEGIASAVAALRDRPDATPGLGAIRVPTLVLVGAEDGVTPPAAAEAMAAAIPGAKLEVLPAAGHLSNLETPEAFNAAVRQFLEALS